MSRRSILFERMVALSAPAGSGSRPDASTPLPMSSTPAVGPAGALSRKPETHHA